MRALEVMKFALAAPLGIGLIFANPAWSETLKGKVEFVAETNVKMFRFKGESAELQSKLARAGNRLDSLELRIPVTTLKTGMDVRDKHTLERIFTAADGTTPDLVFKSTRSECVGEAAEQKCEVSGMLSFRGAEKPCVLSLVLKDGRHVEGRTLIDVLDFGVRPEVLAWTTVKVDNKVPVTFEAEIQ